MWTTVTIDDDVLSEECAIAERKGSSLGRALCELARRSLRSAAVPNLDEGLPVFPVDSDAKPITSEDVNGALSEWP